MGMIWNETGLLLKSVVLSRKAVNKYKTQHMLRRDIAASSLKFLWANFDPLKHDDKSNKTVFALSLWEKYW